MDHSGSHRPWEASGVQSQNQPMQPLQTLPSISTLTANMNQPPLGKAPLNLSMSAVQRDLGNWPIQSSSQPGSSAYSSNHSYSNTSSNRYSSAPYSSDHSAGPTSAATHASPSYTSNPQSQALPSINQNFEPAGHRGSGDYGESRRSSLDSRVHQSMDKLAISPHPTSPYASANASQTSLVSGLQRERGIQPNGYKGSRFPPSGPLSPLGSRARGGFVAGRVAPPIMENPTSQIYNAPVPTAGQPYAFPDSDAVPGGPGSTYSRRNSFAESFTSSVFTTDSRLPAGQQELPDTNTHHHTLQHKQVKTLVDDADSPNSNTPYSRTPELRVTHKLAERKRRSEMKGCFEALRSRLPTNQSNKASKWETLSRAIDYISSLEGQVGKYRNECEKKEVRINELTQQLQRLQQGQDSYATPPGAVPHSPMGYGGQYSNSTAEPPRTLPPLMNGGPMQGVQYGDDRR